MRQNSMGKSGQMKPKSNNLHWKKINNWKTTIIPILATDIITRNTVKNAPIFENRPTHSLVVYINQHIQISTTLLQKAKNLLLKIHI